MTPTARAPFGSGSMAPMSELSRCCTYVSTRCRAGVGRRQIHHPSSVQGVDPAAIQELPAGR